MFHLDVTDDKKGKGLWTFPFFYPDEMAVLTFNV